MKEATYSAFRNKILQESFVFMSGTPYKMKTGIAKV